MRCLDLFVQTIPRMRARAWSASMPDFWASGFFGIRALLFSEDLDLNAYVRARYWGKDGRFEASYPNWITGPAG